MNPVILTKNHTSARKLGTKKKIHKAANVYPSDASIVDANTSVRLLKTN